jgi:hypothetical protein
LPSSSLVKLDKLSGALAVFYGTTTFFAAAITATLGSDFTKKLMSSLLIANKLLTWYLVVGSFAGLSVILAFDIEALDVVLELDLTGLIVPELNRGSEIAL